MVFEKLVFVLVWVFWWLVFVLVEPRALLGSKTLPSQLLRQHLRCLLGEVLVVKNRGFSIQLSLASSVFDPRNLPCLIAWAFAICS